MNRRGVSDRVPKAQIRLICSKVKGTKVRSMVTITVRVIISDMETTTANTTSIGGIFGNRNDRNGPDVPLQNREVTPRYGGDNIARVEDMMHKMIRRFDAYDEHTKELRSDLEGIG